MTTCPFCRSKRIVQLSPHLFRCHTCEAIFDDDPNEGGDYSDDPVRSALMREAAEEKARQKPKRPPKPPDFSRNRRFR